jgi:GNAT superfamily N-acetyltransferase
LTYAHENATSSTRRQTNANSSSHLLRRFEGEYAQVAELAHTVYGYDKETYETYLKWKWEKNPYGSIVVVCECDGQIVGVDALISLPMKINGLTWRCGFVSDLMVHPNFRRQGISTLMGTHLLQIASDHISVVYGVGRRIPHQAAIRHGRLRPVGDITILKKYLSLAGAKHLRTRSEFNLVSLAGDLYALTESVMITSLGAVRRIGNGLHDGPGNDGDPEKIELHSMRFGEEFDLLWQQVQASLPIAVVRSREYLNWRYSNPLATYTVLKAEAHGELQGYCILTYTVQGRHKTAWIVDLLATDPRIGSKLVLEVVRRAKGSGATLLTAWNTKRTARYSGVVMGKSWQKKELIARAVNPNVREAVYDISNWYFTVGDIDLV